MRLIAADRVKVPAQTLQTFPRLLFCYHEDFSARSRCSSVLPVEFSVATVTSAGSRITSVVARSTSKSPWTV